MRFVSRIRSFWIFLALIFVFACRGASADVFSVKRIGNLIPFNDNAFSVNAPEKGNLLIRVHDDISVYRTLEQEIDAGETVIHWDGCGFNHEKLAAKNYMITAVLMGVSGEQYRVSFNTPVEYTGQCLQYLLPSSAKISLMDPDEWFVEFRTVQKGIVSFFFSNMEKDAESVNYTVNTTGGRINRLNYSELTGRNPLSAGSYHVTAYENSKKEETFEFDITVQEECFEKKAVFLTDRILPEEGMTEGEIWQIMQQPSVVIDIDPFKHQKVYREKEKDSLSLGTLHGQTQALRVIRIEEEWAFVGAWNHENADYVEGWVPISVLKVTEPNPDYGILISKQKQTMDVYYRGKLIDTLEVSTGRPDEKHPEQETAAGSFLTGYHRVDFSTNGKKYDYVIQYDGGNLLHQIPYEWGRDKKDFSLGRGYLGAKASHACIRIQSEPGENGINAYWIWTHVPYHTRVLILDDPEERKPVSGRPEIISQIPEKKDDQISIILEDEKWDPNVYPATSIEESGGHPVGTARCYEKEYLRDPTVIAQRISDLHEKGCEKIILKCFWSEQGKEKHTAIQEAMARKGIHAGADLVIGNGNKSFLGCEGSGNGMILYGLGDPGTKKGGKRRNAYCLTAEVIFDTRNVNSRPTVILKPVMDGADAEQIVTRFAEDSTESGIRQVYLCIDQSKQ